MPPDTEYKVKRGELYEHYLLEVDAGQTPVRLDIYLAQRLTHLSRSRLQLAIEAGLVLVDGEISKCSQRVRPHQRIQVRLPYPPPLELTPEPIPLDIYYEDSYLLVVNKPAGMSCHPGAGVYRGTLLNALLYHLHNQPLPATEQNITRPGLVHRIDKDTTGLLVVAKEERAYFGLAKQFFDHTTQRKYYAFVWGIPTQERGTIVANIARDPHQRKKYRAFSDGSQGKHAITHWRIIERFPPFATWIECQLETGRTHQIRVHLSAMGHPLVGDKTYEGHRPRIPLRSPKLGQLAHTLLECLPRQALHAYHLGFKHPITGENLVFEAPMPPDMQAALSFLQQVKLTS
ncbi:MAG: RluA family pseudouridine synthase [Bacteroidia bacterium]|nr:RluA family pseudouridine synthase [Bacteroidia bacterium]MDW8235737.1 RluA family pseudouridine synthase [Bacteroidia bacterium]MDW8417615.1 RluA family pseudouridine synthase [Bacteroidia bacterium]